MDNIFSGAWEPFDSTPLPVEIPLPSTVDSRNMFTFLKKLWIIICWFVFWSDLVGKCSRLLAKSKRPLILMGSQSTLPPTCSEDLVRALHKLGIPCYLGGMSRGMLGPKSPLQVILFHSNLIWNWHLLVYWRIICSILGETMSARCTERGRFDYTCRIRLWFPIVVRSSVPSQNSNHSCKPE